MWKNEEKYKCNVCVLLSWPGHLSTLSSWCFTTHRRWTDAREAGTALPANDLPHEKNRTFCFSLWLPSMSSVSHLFFFRFGFFAHLQQSGLSEQLGHRHSCAQRQLSTSVVHPPARPYSVRVNARLLNLLPSCESLAPISQWFLVFSFLVAIDACLTCFLVWIFLLLYKTRGTFLNLILVSGCFPSTFSVIIASWFFSFFH